MWFSSRATVTPVRRIFAGSISWRVESFLSAGFDFQDIRQNLSAPDQETMIRQAKD